MKLRYFYLLYFLVPIDWCFCYDTISKDLDPVRRGARAKHVQRRRSPQEDEEDRDEIASLDIGNFIEQPDPDYERVIEDTRYDQSRRRLSKNDDEFSSLNELQAYLDMKSKENLNNNFDDASLINYDNVPDLFKDNAESTLDDNAISAKENSLKKSRRRQAVPFFSHEKEKKHKKRKFLNFSLKSTSTTTLPKFDGSKPPMKTNFNKIFKRSTFRFCPLCKRKILPKKKSKPSESSMKNNIVHNSRQFYQNQTKQKKKSTTNNLHSSNVDRGVGVSEKEVRKKRSNDKYQKEYTYTGKPNDSDYMKQRQLHELEELEKRVDDVEIVGLPDNTKQKGSKVMQ